MHRSHGLQHLRYKRPTRRNRGLPDEATAGLCVASEIAPITTFATLDSATLLYNIHTVPGSLRTLTISNSAILDHLSSRFSTSRTNGPRSLSRAKVGTHSAFGEGSHTRAYTPKQGLFRMGVVSLPSIRAARSRTSPGRVSERRTLPLSGLGRGRSRKTQRDCGTAMRLCASLSRRRRGPAGLRDLFTFVEVAACTPCAQGLSACARRGVVSPLLVCSACC